MFYSVRVDIYTKLQGVVMTEFTSYPSGTFSWVDLATSDPDAAKKFYTGLFGWEFSDMPAGPDSTYTMFHLGGKNVSALYELNEEQRKMNLPPHWVSYISVDDISATANKVKELGGNVVVEPFPVMESGHMAAIQDPTGAFVALWQPGQHIGADICNEPGSLSWNELQTHDPAKAKEFYTGVFGWGTDVTDMGDFEYTSFTVGERMNGGMMQIQPDWGEVPPNWTVYFAVANCDGTAAKVTELGGRVIMPPSDIPNTGRFAIIQDPQGAVFQIIQMLNPE